MSVFEEHDEEETLLRLELVEAVAQLPPKLRIVTALLSAGYSQQECASILGLTRGAVGLIYKRARTSIENILANGLGFDARP